MRRCQGIRSPVLTFKHDGRSAKSLHWPKRSLLASRSPRSEETPQELSRTSLPESRHSGAVQTGSDQTGIRAHSPDRLDGSGPFGPLAVSGGVPSGQPRVSASAVVSFRSFQPTGFSHRSRATARHRRWRCAIAPGRLGGRNRRPVFAPPDHPPAGCPLILHAPADCHRRAAADRRGSHR